MTDPVERSLLRYRAMTGYRKAAERAPLYKGSGDER